jgi:hypothetical protein
LPHQPPDRGRPARLAAVRCRQQQHAGRRPPA